jgi:hypothetical protein
MSNDIEIIVVDNGSRVDEAAVIHSRYPSVTAIRSDQNLGFAGGNNLGIKASKGKYLFFINNDTVFRSGKTEVADPKSEIRNQMEALMARMESSKEIGMICPKIRFAWDDNPIQYAGFTPLSKITLRNKSIGYGEKDKGQYEHPHLTPYAHGAAMLVRREAVERAGLMPECYFLYYEELDWSLMITRAGYTIWYDPLCTIYHKESQSTGQNSPLKCYYLTRNRFIFARRNIHYPIRILTYLYLLIGVYPRDVLKYLFSRQYDLVHATTKGLLDFISTRPTCQQSSRSSSLR